MLAARGGSPRIVERLRSAGARVGLFEAAALGDLETVRSVIGAEPASACAATVDQTTPLHLAGSVEVAEALLAAGADLAAADAYGRRPLDAAIGAAARRPDGSRAIADHLIESGAAVDASTFAALGDLARLGPVLKSDPASIHRIGGSGSPPLHAAVAHGRLDTVRWLLENGADANAGDSVGVYPLHLTSSAHHHSVEIARELLAAGADPAAKDGAEEATPASWAEFQRLPELEKLLRTTLD